ncbi:MAG: DUF2190 family protein [Alphaproteobacteria bacterium]|nr:DUF2190 family protein [Alphaproteobacteria bacterium]
MATNFIQPGDTLTIPAAAVTLSGEPVVIGAITGVALGDAGIGTMLDVATEGVFELNKVAANTFAVGAACYWDATAGLITSTTTGNTKFGYAIEAVIAGTATVKVRLIAF